MTDLNDLFYAEYYGDIHAINEDIYCALYDEELCEEQGTQGEIILWNCLRGVLNMRSSRIEC